VWNSPLLASPSLFSNLYSAINVYTPLLLSDFLSLNSGCPAGRGILLYNKYD